MINKGKVINAALYFCKNTNKKEMGATKFLKLFYYLDFISLSERGITVTGEEKYIKDKYGPVSDFIEKEYFDFCMDVSSIFDKFLTMTKKTWNINGKSISMNRISALAEPNTDVFSEYELELLKTICIKWKDASCTKIYKETHKEIPWNSVDLKEQISFRTAFLENFQKKFQRTKIDDALSQEIKADVLMRYQ